MSTTQLHQPERPPPNTDSIQPHTQDNNLNAAPSPVSPIDAPANTGATQERAATSTPTTALPQQHQTPLPAPLAQHQTPLPGPYQGSIEPDRTYLEQLNAAEQHWAWKHGLRAILVLVAVIGLGTNAAAVAASHDNEVYDYYYSTIWGVITFSATILWSAILTATFLLRRHPAHPGISVAFDLILWLAYIPTGLILIYAYTRLSYIGSSSWVSYEFSDSSGSYEQFSNGTYYWDPSPRYATSTRSCDVDDSSSDTYGSSYYNSGGYFGSSSYNDFTSCAEQDAFVNSIASSHSRHASTLLAAVVCQWLALLLHFVLFVWACVDTARFNRRHSTNTEAEILASQIVMRIVRNGQMPGQQQGGFGQFGQGQYAQGPYYPLGNGQGQGIQMQNLNEKGQMPMQGQGQQGWPLQNGGQQQQPSGGVIYR